MKFIKVLVVLAGLGVITLFILTHPALVASRAIGSGECAEVKVNVDFGPQYEGKLIDTHIHMPDDQLSWLLPFDPPATFSDYACTFMAEGTSHMFAFFPVHKWFMPQSKAIVEAINERYPGLVTAFIMPPDNDGSPKGFPTVPGSVLSGMLDQAPGIFKGYGEIGLYERGDHGGPKGAPALSPDSPRMQAIYPVIREHNLLIYVHLGEGQQESFERALATNRNINFIFHGDQLVAYRDGTQDLSALEEILYRNPNVYYGVDELYGDKWLLKPEISKEEFLAHFENYQELLEQDVDTWKGFIERHPNQVLWGTDRGWFGGWSLEVDTGIYLTRYARTFIARLDPSVQEKFAYRNARKLIGEE